MMAIERTTKQFVASVSANLPDLQISVSRSKTDWGRSNYVHLRLEQPDMYLKIRISDHPVGMRRAVSGEEALFLHARAKPQSWAVWLSRLCRRVEKAKQ